jgi:hypothetical protein
VRSIPRSPTCSTEMRDLNRAFKAARKVDRSLRYHNYLHAEKAAMLDAMARESAASARPPRAKPAAKGDTCCRSRCPSELSNDRHERRRVWAKQPDHHVL